MADPTARDNLRQRLWPSAPPGKTDTDAAHAGEPAPGDFNAAMRRKLGKPHTQIQEEPR